MSAALRQKLLETLGPSVHVLGIMGGTSMDGLDLALLTFEGEAFTVTNETDYIPFSASERNILADAMGKRDDKRAHDVVTQAHIKAVQQWQASDRTQPDLIGFHGQTILHDPGQKLTVQVGDPQALADAVGLPVIADLRQNDVSQGGQGAPLVPIYHQARLGPVSQPVVLVNIGGVSNITYMDEAGTLLAFDTGPGNAPLDDWAQYHLGEPFDRDGALAAKGKVHQALVDDFIKLPFFEAVPPKSLDRESLPIQELVKALSPEDGAATLIAMTIEAIADAARWLPQPPSSWSITGGGRHNKALMRGLAQRMESPVYPIEDLGWNGDMIEAEAFAYLAMRSLWQQPITFPGTTGVTEPLSGGRLFLPDAD